MKTKEIEKIIYKSSNQSVSYREIYQVQDKKIKLDIKSDSYHSQCCARSYVLKADEWLLVYSIPYSLMKTPEGLIYKADYKNKPASAEREFIEDIKKLKEQTEKILF